jgi:REP element-mobilizing transposase RayT
LALRIIGQTWYTVSMQREYRHNPGSVVLIKYHIIWIPRRWRRVLGGKVAECLETPLREKAQELEVEIEHLAILPDHLHLCHRRGYNPQIGGCKFPRRADN